MKGSAKEVQGWGLVGSNSILVSCTIVENRILVRLAYPQGNIPVENVSICIIGLGGMGLQTGTIQQQPRERMDPKLGRVMLAFIRQRTGLLQWFDSERNCINNGSVFFVRTSHTSFAVTARHVYEAFEETAAKGPVVARLNNQRLNLLSRLISRGQDADIATFEILPHEMDWTEIQPIPWPPYMPAEGKTVLFGGYPGIGKRFTGPKEITWGIYHGLARVDGFNDRDISMVTPPDDEMIDLVGKGLPPRNIDAGGMSGGPVITPFREVSGEFRYSLSGVIYECQANLEIMKAARADAIDERGRLHG